MRSTLLSAVFAVGLIAPALAQTGVAPAYPPMEPQQGYPPPAYPQQAPPPQSYSTQPPPPGAPVPSYVPPSNVPPPGANYETGARPGNQIGSGMSMPMSDRASNINGRDTRSEIAPNLPSPVDNPNASPIEFLRAAQASLAAGHTGAAQEALEQAQTRLLDRSVDYGETSNPSDNPAVAQISRALHALANRDRVGCMQLIQSAIEQIRAMRR